MEESLEDHNKRACVWIFSSIQCHFLFGAHICCSLFPQIKAKLCVLNFGWPLNRNRITEKSIIGTTKRWPRHSTCRLVLQTSVAANCICLYNVVLIQVHGTGWVKTYFKTFVASLTFHISLLLHSYCQFYRAF